MATGKKFYWLKLKESFLTSEKVDFLLSQKNGANYVVIYQMLCLKTLNTGGELCTTIGEVLIPFDINKIQRDLKHFDIDTILVALNLYKKLGMVYEQANGVIKITGFSELVGCETDYARQKRLQRQGVDNSVDIVHIENRDKSIEIRDKKDIEEDLLKEQVDMICDRHVEACLYDTAKAFLYKQMILKAYYLTGGKTLPIGKLEDCILKINDNIVSNPEGYLYQCFKNGKVLCVG